MTGCGKSSPVRNSDNGRNGQLPEPGGPGVKRARVQVLVQGEGGRVIRKENWLIGLRDGESLA